MPHEFNKHFAEQKKYKIRWQLLFTQGFKSPNPFATVKYLPKGLNPPVRIMIAGAKVFIVDFSKPMVTIVIEKKEIAESYKRHFKLLWKMATN